MKHIIVANVEASIIYKGAKLMREIKFRAWFTRNEKYIKPMTIQNMIHQKVSTFSLSVLYNEVVFEQYTGLEDFNGIEIYEGDILQDVDDSTIVGVVEYDEAFGEYDCGDNNLYECTRDCVVIGNIHENADLLEEQ